MSMRITRAAIAAAALGLTALITAPQAGAQIINSDRHQDIGAAYDGDNLFMIVGNEFQPEPGEPEELDPSEVIFEINPALAEVANGGTYNFFSGAPGASVFIAPEVQVTGLPLIGISAETLDPLDFLSDNVQFTLVSVTGVGGSAAPGFFTIFSDFNNPNVLMNTSDGITAADLIFAEVGGEHTDYNFGFSALGTYDVTFQISAIRAGETVPTTATGTYRFVVGSASAAAVPEPGTFALAGFAVLPVLGVVAARRRRNRCAV